MTKICSKCKKAKSLLEFHNNKAQADGLSNQCKQCCSERNKQRTKDGYWPEFYKKYGGEKRAEYHRKYYKENKEVLDATNKERYLNNREEILSREKVKYNNDPELRRHKIRINTIYRQGKSRRKETLQKTVKRIGKYDAKYLQKWYGEQFEKQHGRCAICGVHQLETGKALSIDHDHQTKELRGLLCNSCNIGIGYLKHNPESLAKACSYLNRSKVKIRKVV